MLSPKYLLSTSIVALCSTVAMSASAATVTVGAGGDYVAQSETYVGTEDNPDAVDTVTLGENEDFDQRVGLFDAAPGSVSASAGLNDSGEQFSYSATSEASGDTATGELKTRTAAEAEATGIVAGTDATSVFSPGFSAGARISEVFTLNGSGTASFNMFVDVEWDGDVLFNGSIRGQNLDTGENFFLANEDTVRVETGFFSDDDPLTGSIENQLVTLNIDFVDALDTQLEIFWNIGGFVYTSDFCLVDFNPECDEPDQFSRGLLDASSTANIFFSGSENLSVVATSNGFLSDSRFQTYMPDTGPSPVPLPAGLPLLLAGLLGLGLVSRRSTKS